MTNIVVIMTIKIVKAFDFELLLIKLVELYRIISKGGSPVPLLNQLKVYRAKLGINQAELGQIAGVSRQTISLIERGDYSPSVSLALKLAKICQTTVEELFQYEED